MELDVRETTRHNPKYRRGPGEIIIVNHDGRGRWDPLSDAKGDIFNLVQRLNPGLDFIGAKRTLRQFAGLSPEQVAELLQLTRRTFDRDWRYARAFLHSALE